MRRRSGWGSTHSVPTMTPMSMRALVRKPSPRLAEGIVTHAERVAVDPDLAMRQWEDYVAALRTAGWQTIEVPPAEDCPDGVFIEDMMVVFRDLAVISRPGAAPPGDHRSRGHRGGRRLSDRAHHQPGRAGRR